MKSLLEGSRKSDGNKDSRDKAGRCLVASDLENRYSYASERKTAEKMPDEFTVGHVPKFDGTNFLGWKFQIEAALRASGVYEIVDGTKMKPEPPQGEPAKTWVKDNAMAMYIISRAMEYRQLESLLVCTTAKEMWDTLTRIHQQSSEANKLVVMQKFHEYRMSSTDTVMKHVAKVRNMAR